MSEAAAVVEGEHNAFSHRQIQVIFTGVMLGMLLAAMDQTIVATALPTIAGDLGGLSHLSWVITAYLLASTVTTPIWGKFSDLYGRKTVYQTAIVLFLAGSALCGFAHSMNELIVFRGLQGIGSGGIISGAMSIIGDVLSPRERGRYQGYTMSVWSFASISGPAVGGLITEHLSWRWCFYVNLPIGAVALIVTSVVLNLDFTRVPHRIDWAGAALLVGGISSVLLVTVWGGGEDGWLSPTIIGLLFGAVALIALFVRQEQRAPEPILPLRLFRNPTFRQMNATGFLVAMAMFGTTAYLPLFLQTVTGIRPTLSGLLLMPQSFSSTIAGIVVGRLVSRTGRYKRYPVVGACLMPTGLLLLSTMNEHTPELLVAAYMVILGTGMGMIVPVMMIGLQNSVQREDLGTATSSNMFFRNMGGSFGVALFGSVLTARLTHYFPLVVPRAAAARLHLSASRIALSPAAIRALPHALRGGLIDAFALSLHAVFLVAGPVALVTLPILLRVREIPLRSAAYVRDAARAALTEVEVGDGDGHPDDSAPGGRAPLQAGAR
ncbi:MAG TPA: MDR family MFS transporter [Acidimicrobiales bacterium]|nr:MDR family MFS transporter [Acidimicrobiales bacterium]